MSVHMFLLFLGLGSAAIALWVDARFPRLAPASIQLALVHVFAALIAGELIVPGGLDIAIERGSPIAGILAVALPALTYAFLAAVWVMKLLRSSVAGFR